MNVFTSMVTGIGFGLMYLPSIVMVSFYFDKRRALATGIGVCGSGVGTFVLAPFFSFLVSQYGWKVSRVWIGWQIFAARCLLHATFCWSIDQSSIIFLLADVIRRTVLRITTASAFFICQNTKLIYVRL